VYYDGIDPQRFNNGKVITSLNLKGGVGKTHVCWMLASVCQERSRRCLIVDLDQQANITQSLLPGHTTATGIELVFDPATEPDSTGLIHSTRYSHIDLIPATEHFARFDLSQPEQWERERLHTALADTLAEIVPHYDFVLLDCPPRISLSSYAALCASDFVVIPLEAADWGARGTATVRAAIDRVRDHDNPQLQLLGYVVSKFKRRRAFQMAYLAQIREAFGAEAFKTVIPDYARFERSVDNAIPITLHSPSSNASRIARQLFDEVQSRISSCRVREKYPRLRAESGKGCARAETSSLAR
jgi:chromosome partitioning protein